MTPSAFKDHVTGWMWRVEQEERREWARLASLQAFIANALQKKRRYKADDFNPYSPKRKKKTAADIKKERQELLKREAERGRQRSQHPSKAPGQGCP